MKNVKKTSFSHPKKLCLATCMTLLAGNPVRLVNGEEASILDGATVPIAPNDWTGDVNKLINGSYKSYIKTKSKTNPVFATIDLPYP